MCDTSKLAAACSGCWGCGYPGLAFETKGLKGFAGPKWVILAIVRSICEALPLGYLALDLL